MTRAFCIAALSAAVSAGLAGCGQRTDLPPAPTIAPGEGFSNATSFDSERIMTLCEQANTVADAGGLRGYTDAQIANGTCELSAVAVEMISRGDDPAQQCVAATAAMIKSSSDGSRTMNPATSSGAADHSGD